MLPGRKRTYAPRGCTPILHAPCRYDHLSVMAAVTMEGQFYARVRARSLNSFDSVAFVQRLQARWPENKLLVIWDGSPIHRFKAMCAFQQTPAAANFTFERLPGYAPDLNPLDTGVWHHLKNVTLANVCCQNLDQLQEELARAIKALRAKPRLIQACFGTAKLSLQL
ncbi:MAG: transposase [Acidobacteria bacterium]|nr:transposase [Acidobacteriota bacterium]